MKLSVIVPAYNEERYIGRVLKKLKSLNLKSLKLGREIIVVNDGSSDRTASIASSFCGRGIRLINLRKNRGKGAAIRAGLKEATGSIIIIQDADLEYNPDEIIDVIRPIADRKAAVVYGSRYLNHLQKARHKVFLKTHKRSCFAFYLGGRALTFFTNLLYGTGITDEATCYKAFRAELIKSLDLKCVGFEFCPEVTAKVAKLGYRILEVPITYKPRSFNEGKKINFKDGIEALWTLLRLRFTR